MGNRSWWRVRVADAVCALLLTITLAGPAIGQESGASSSAMEPAAVEPPIVEPPAKQDEHYSTLDINPFGLVIGMASLEYQHTIRNDLSLSVRGSFWKMDIEEWRFQFIGAGVGMRKYWGGRAPRGGYMALNLDAGILEVTYTNALDLMDTAVAFNLIPNVMFGYSWLLGRFHIDAGIGVSYLMGEVVVLGSRFPYSGLYPSLGFNIGFAF
ncbi:MAG: hypothetical protein OEZ04_05435 [Nitrospinota bacterium]|nr:hypothetical protein [Nitrospinota bacterium]